MAYLNHTVQLLAGGEYIGNQSWNDKHTEWDNCFKLYHITKGSLFINGENGKYILEEGKFYFINGYKLKYYGCDDSFSCYWLHFTAKNIFAQYALQTTPTVIEIPLGIVGNNMPIKDISLIIEGRVESYINNYLQSLQLHTYIQFVICWLLKDSILDDLQKNKNFNSILVAVEYIETHFSEQIRLKKLADLCFMSTNYFHKIFTESLNTTPINYITQQRMNKAIALLNNQNQSIKEIAYQLGYCTDAYFSNSFKKYYGITPGEYKKKGSETLFRVC